jgi:tetratricopeptide (TPR) repeat protein
LVQRLSGVLESVLDRPAAAIATYRRTLDLDPLSAAAYHSLGVALHAVDDFPGAEGALQHAVELAPQRIASHAHLAMNALAQGRLDEALAAASREPETGYRLWALAIAHRALGNVAAANDALQVLIDEHAAGWSLQVAEVFAMSGDADASFDWLDRAYERRDTGLAHVRAIPRLRSLHADARWSAFLARMGFDAGIRGT